MRLIHLPTNDLVYDRFTRKIYASVPSRAERSGNSVTFLDPDTGTIESSVFVGSEPAKLALSDNGQALYVALNGAGAVSRFDVATRTPGAPFYLGGDPDLGPYVVEDMQVLPGLTEVIAVARRQPKLASHRGVAIYDRGVARPHTTPVHSVANRIVFRATAERLYGINTETSGFGFRRRAVD